MALAERPVVWALRCVEREISREIGRKRGPKDDPHSQGLQELHQVGLLPPGEVQPEAPDIVLDHILEGPGRAIVEVGTGELRWVPEPAEGRGTIPLGRTASRVGGILPYFPWPVQPPGRRSRSWARGRTS